MKILKPTKSNISRCAGMIRNGALVAMPTETVYGLAGNALNIRSVAKIFEVKKRPVFDPLIVHISQKKDAEKYAEVNSLANELIKHFWPGPLTVVLPKKKIIPDLVTAGMETVALRIPKHPVARDLIRESGLPLAAPSANLFMRTSPTEPEAVKDQLQGKVDIVLDGGKCRVGLESTVVMPSGRTVQILRPGAVTADMIKEKTGARIRYPKNRGLNSSPGMLEKHYCPVTPIVLADKSLRKTEGDIEKYLAGNRSKKRLGLIGFGKIVSLKTWDRAVSLSEKKDLTEAASNLFSTMRWMDGLGLDLIVAERVPDKGIGKAVLDRLERASHGNILKKIIK